MLGLALPHPETEARTHHEGQQALLLVLGHIEAEQGDAWRACQAAGQRQNIFQGVTKLMTDTGPMRAPGINHQDPWRRLPGASGRGPLASRFSSAPSS